MRRVLFRLALVLALRALVAVGSVPVDPLCVEHLQGELREPDISKHFLFTSLCFVRGWNGFDTSKEIKRLAA